MASAGPACWDGKQTRGCSCQCPVGAEGAHVGQAIQLVSALVAADLAEQIGQAPIQPGMPGTILMHGLTQWHYCKRPRADQRTIWRVFAQVARRVRVLSVMAFRQPPSSAGRVHGSRLTRGMAKVLPGPRRSTCLRVPQQRGRRHRGGLRGMPGEGPGFRTEPKAHGREVRACIRDPRRLPDRSRPGHGPAAWVRYRGGCVHGRGLTAALCAQPGLDRWGSSSETGKQRHAVGRGRPHAEGHDCRR